MSVSKYPDGASKAAGVSSHQSSQIVFIGTISDHIVYLLFIVATCDSVVLCLDLSHASFSFTS